MRGTGACCLDPDDCGPEHSCLGGYCSRRCETRDDCGPLRTPTPFEEGIELSCLPTSAGRWCLPGSGEECDGPFDCPEREVCTIVIPPPGDPSPPRRCLARVGLDGTGEACDPSLLLRCETPPTPHDDGTGLALHASCLEDRCTFACDPGAEGSCGDRPCVPLPGIPGAGVCVP